MKKPMSFFLFFLIISLNSHKAQGAAEIICKRVFPSFFLTDPTYHKNDYARNHQWAHMHAADIVAFGYGQHADILASIGYHNRTYQDHGLTGDAHIIKFWHPTTSRLVAAHGMDDVAFVYTLNWSPNGELLACTYMPLGGYKMKVKVLRVNFEKVHDLCMPSNPTFENDVLIGTSLAWSPDSTQLMVVVQDDLSRYLQVFDLRTHAWLEPLYFGDDNIYDLTWATPRGINDPEHITLCHSNGTSVYTRAGEETLSFISHSHEQDAAEDVGFVTHHTHAYSRSMAFLATSRKETKGTHRSSTISRSGRIKRRVKTDRFNTTLEVWHTLDSSKPIATLAGYNAKFSPADSTWLAFKKDTISDYKRSNKIIFLHNLRTKQQYTLKAASFILEYCWSAAGTEIACALGDGRIQVFNIGHLIMEFDPILCRPTRATRAGTRRKIKPQHKRKANNLTGESENKNARPKKKQKR